jgi:hypothetical protein
MTLAEKITRAKADYDEVFDAGYDKGVYETEIWDALLGTPEFTLDGFKTPNVVLNIKNLTNIRYLTQNRTNYANKIVKHLTINCPNQVSQAFGMTQRWDNCITHLTLNVDFSLVANFNSNIQGLEVLEVIDGTPLNWSSATSGTNGNFNRCFKLREVRFAPNSLPLQMSFGDSPELSDDSINSIINGLMQLENTQTIKFHKTVGEKLTDGQKSVIAIKGWTLAY